MKEILNRVLDEIKPTREDEKKILDIINNVVSKLNKNLRKARAELGGSGAKGTWLREAYDADIFVRFDYKEYSEKSDELSEILQKIMKKCKFQFSRLHGSRDYFQIKKRGFTIEIIPILNIRKSSMAKNITDVSPLHTAFVKKYKDLRDEIRLAKQFCKSNNVYGAESYIQGFSGYVIEILVIYYGGFLKLLKSSKRWGDKQVIDLKNYHNNVFMEINKSKLESPLIVIDPVDPRRNAAAALGKEKYGIFLDKSEMFLKKPNMQYFEIEKIDAIKLKNRYKGKNLILVEAEGLEGKEDVVGSKLRKAYEHILDGLKDFQVKETNWSWDFKKAIFWFNVGKKEIDKIEIKEGPPVKIKDHTKNFIKRYRNSFIDKGRVYAKVKRKYYKINDVVKELIKDKYVKEKVKAIKHVK
ncbi:MAG: CCA tRNA nucleotidyltransferase [Candidatus Woesearchaeota archaeon]